MGGFRGVGGDRLDVDNNTGVSVVSVTETPAAGKGGRQRVRALFVPEHEPQPAPAAKPKS